MKKSNWIFIDTAFGKSLINLDYQRKMKPDNGNQTIIYDISGGHEVARESLQDIALRIVGQPTPSKPDTDWIETHHEIVTAIALAENNKSTNKATVIREAGGTGAIYEFAEMLTNKFQGIHEETVWGEEFQYFDYIEAFCESHIY